MQETLQFKVDTETQKLLEKIEELKKQIFEQQKTIRKSLILIQALGKDVWKV